MARDQNTFNKRQREADKKRKADDKRKRRDERKKEPPAAPDQAAPDLESNVQPQP